MSPDEGAFNSTAGQEIGAIGSGPAREFVDIAAGKLRSGDWSGAISPLREALARDATDISSWLSLAGALHRLNRTDEERSALERVLALQPRNLQALFEIARHHERRGERPLAAAAYRTALECIPARTELTPEASAAIRNARAVIHANNLALEAFLDAHMRELRARFVDESLGRFDKALDTFLLKRRVYRPRPSFLYVPQLPDTEFYEREDFPWLHAIEAATDDIRAELMDVLADAQAPLRPYVAVPGAVADKWRELNHSRRWSAFFFWREGVAYSQNMVRCPRTMAALEAWPRCEMPGCAPTAMFSILEPHTRIPPHTGVNNARLVVHAPLVVPPGCGFRVGAETRAWIPGQAFVFDDTIEHEAWNDSDERRAVLIVDIWNPLLSAAEREMVCALTTGIDAFYGDLPRYIRPVHSEA
jgi:aspartyl/asparaginyl beta-hydroxylase (cupin superfamily)